MIKKINLLLCCIVGMMIFSCDEVKNQSSTLKISLTDTPGVYDHVFVDITGVEVHTDGGGWQVLPTTTAIYDLNVLRNGVDTTIVNPQLLPAGKITQVRLILGDSNTVVVDSVTYPLSLSSQDETGLKCVLNNVLQPNVSYQLMLDFDAGNSVIETGNGNYKLKPVVKAFFQ